MKTQLFIPKQIHIGQVKRSDTYSGKLGYVIYTDNKGVKRKETSWEGWRDKNIKPLDLDNIPTEGFVLNKGAGGHAGSSSSWNIRRETIRVYDPRGFEFEISVANLLFILEHSSSIKGKGLEGNFLYSWDGKELVLLPEACKEYQDSLEFMKLSDTSVKAKELIIGATYLTKKDKTLVYMGKLDHYVLDQESKSKPGKPKTSWRDYNNNKYITKQFKTTTHIFYDPESKVFIPKSSASDLSQVVDSNCISNYADLMDQYLSTEQGSAIVRLEHIPFKITKPTDKTKKEYHGNTNMSKFILNKDGSYRELLIQSTFQNIYNNGGYDGAKFVGYRYYELGTTQMLGNQYNKGYIYPDRQKYNKSWLSKNEVYESQEDMKKLGLVTLYMVLSNGVKKVIKTY